MNKEKKTIICEDYKGDLPSLRVGRKMDKDGYFIRHNPDGSMAPLQICRIETTNHNE